MRYPYHWGVKNKKQGWHVSFTLPLIVHTAEREPPSHLSFESNRARTGLHEAFTLPHCHCHVREPPCRWEGKWIKWRRCDPTCCPHCQHWGRVQVQNETACGITPPLLLMPEEGSGTKWDGVWVAHCLTEWKDWYATSFGFGIVRGAMRQHVGHTPPCRHHGNEQQGNGTVCR
jgi:hypothetical protein